MSNGGLAQIDTMAPLTNNDFENKKLPESPERQLSPGRGAIKNRRPPSPGGIHQMTPTSVQSPITQNSNTSASPKRRPIPGGGSMVSPNYGIDFSDKSLQQNSPNTNGSKRRPPSPGMGSNSPLRRRPPSPGDIGRDVKEKSEPKRFVFSSEATGVTPSRINVSSLSTKSIKWANDAMGDDDTANKESLSKPQSLGMKNSNNPIRNNPQFLQELAEESDSEDDEDLDDSGGMNNLKQITQLTAATKDTAKKDNDKNLVSPSVKKKDNFAHPAKHWVNLQVAATKEKEIPSSDVLVQKYTEQYARPSDGSVSSVDSSNSVSNKKLTPRNKAVYQKFREARERQLLRSHSPNKPIVTKEKKKANKSVSPPRRRSIIKPSPIKASSHLFVPIRKRSNGDDHSISSYSTQSFDSAMYGGKKNKVSLAQRARRASSRSPMRFRSFDESVKTNQNKDNYEKVNSLLQAQNRAIKQMGSLEKITKPKDDEQSKQSISRLSTNLARLKALKEERKLREEEKKKSSYDYKPGKNDILSHQNGKTSLNDKKATIAEDEFTADCADITVGPRSMSQSSKSTNSSKKNDINIANNNNNNNKLTQWSVVLQNKLGSSADDVSSFDDEFKYNDLGWNFDKSAPKQANLTLMKQSEDTEVVIDDIAPYFDRNAIKTNDDNYFVPPPIKQVNVSFNRGNNSYIPHNADHDLQQPPVPPTAVTQPVQTAQNIDINPYTGPYAQLLPRSTNPLIVRTHLPTLSCTLTNFQSIQPPPTVIPTHSPSHQQSIQYIQSQTQNPIQALHHTNHTNASHQMKIYPDNYPYSVNGFSSTQSSDNPVSVKGYGQSDDFVFSQSAPDTRSEGKNGTKKSDDDSTLIGQNIIPLNDNEKSPESVSKWWESKYADSHNEEVNKVVKQALDRIDEKLSPLAGTIKMIESKLDLHADSDDDIFSGIESPRKQLTLKEKGNVKSKSEKELDTILSGDEDSHSNIIGEQKSDASSPQTSKISAKDSNSKKCKKTKKSQKANENDRESIKENVPFANGRISARSARNGRFLPCGKIETNSFSDDSDSSSSSDSKNRGRQRNGGRRAKRGDDSDVDDKSNFTIKISKSSDSDDRRLHQSDKERKFWRDWDRKDNQSQFSDSASIDHILVPKEQIESNNERRSRAYEKLLMHAYIALSKPPPESKLEKGEAPKVNSQKAPSNEYRFPTSSMQYNYSQLQQIVPENNNFYPEDNGSEEPIFSDIDSYVHTGSVTSGSNNGKGNTSIPNNSSVTSFILNPPGQVPRGINAKNVSFQITLLEKFCVRIQRTPLEVLKLNRDEKWQTRFLTVSKEGSRLKKSTKDETCFCPLGLLWVKKVNKSREHSVLTIDKQGRGGILLANLVRVNVADNEQGTNKMTKIQLKKYHDSCIVTLHAKSSFVTFRAERDDADAIMVGCNAIIEVLQGTNIGNSSRPASSNSSAQSLHSRVVVSNRSGVASNNVGSANASISSNNRKMVSSRSVASSNFGGSTTSRNMGSNHSAASRNVGNSATTNRRVDSTPGRMVSYHTLGSAQLISNSSSSLVTDNHILSKTFVANDLWET